MNNHSQQYFSNIRVGRKYKLMNDGEVFEFQVLRKIGYDEYLLKDIHTLEKYHLQDLVKYGISKNFSLEEIDN